MRAAATLTAGWNLGAFVWLILREVSGTYEPTDVTLGPLCLGIAVVLAFVAARS